MGRHILVVSDDTDRLFIARKLLEINGDQVTCATLSREKAELCEDYPYVGDIIAQHTGSAHGFDAGLIYDMSKPRHGSGIEFPLSILRDTGSQLATLDEDMKPLPIDISSEGSDPVLLSIRREELERSMEASHRDAIEKRRELLTRGHNAAESLLLTNPPSEKGIGLIRRLRTEGSGFDALPIMVGDAHPDRKATLLDAGATLVHTSADRILTPVEMIDAAFHPQQYKDGFGHDANWAQRMAHGKGRSFFKAG